MGERKGTNKYYPPDYDPRAGGLNKFLGTHALRERARKIHMGIIIIRFEMPYNIWCEGCNNHIGMGVRYNAEKKKAGMYYTTPVYEFKMKCHLCDNHIVMKTDPGNLDYIILSGARRQENRWDPTKNEQVVPETKEVQKRLFDDSMFKLEHGSTDQTTAASEKPRLIKLYNRNESIWSDHYTSNQTLRANFRKRNRALAQTAEDDKRLLKKSSLDIPLLPEREEDRKYASLLSMVPCRSSAENDELQRKIIISTPALPSSNLNFIREQKAVKVMKAGVRDLGIVPKALKSHEKVGVKSGLPSMPQDAERLCHSDDGTGNVVRCTQFSKSPDINESTSASLELGENSSAIINTTLLQPDGNSVTLNTTANLQDEPFSNTSDILPSIGNTTTIGMRLILQETQNNDVEKNHSIDENSSEKMGNSLTLLGDYGSSSDTD